MPSESQFRELLRYLIDQVWRHERRPVRTRMMKLLYLLDVAHASTHAGATWSGLSWRFHHYGPYSEQLQKLLDRMDGIDATDEEGQGPRGTYHVYGGAHGAADTTDLTRLLDSSDRAALRRIVDEWCGADLNALLDYVYFETPPMRDVSRGDLLDFNATQMPFRRLMVRNPTLPADRLALLRGRLRSRTRPTAGVPMSELTHPLSDVDERALARAEGVPVQIPDGIVELRHGREG